MPCPQEMLPLSAFHKKKRLVTVCDSADIPYYSTTKCNSLFSHLCATHVLTATSRTACIHVRFDIGRIYHKNIPDRFAYYGVRQYFPELLVLLIRLGIYVIKGCIMQCV
jgi:hypothetical protein